MSLNPHAHHDHAHDGHHGHTHLGEPARAAHTPWALQWAVVITLGFALVEAIGGWWAGSLALLSDASHMLSDAAALAMAAFAGWVASRPPTARHSYGLGRAEVIAASLNALLMLALIVTIVVEAVARLRSGAPPVAGGAVMLIALAGLAINAVVAWMLTRAQPNLNVRAALVHVMGDLFGSVAALIAGAVIYFTGWYPIDALLSILVAGLILYSTLRLLREALHVLMEGVPRSLNLQHVGRQMARISGVRSVHDLHIWSLASGRSALSAHIEVDNLPDWPAVLEAQRAMLREQFAIDHVTLQPEQRPAAGDSSAHVVRFEPRRIASARPTDVQDTNNANR